MRKKGSWLSCFPDGPRDSQVVMRDWWRSDLTNATPKGPIRWNLTPYFFLCSLYIFGDKDKYFALIPTSGAIPVSPLCWQWTRTAIQTFGNFMRGGRQPKSSSPARSGSKWALKTRLRLHSSPVEWRHFLKISIKLDRCTDGLIAKCTAWYILEHYLDHDAINFFSPLPTPLLSPTYLSVTNTPPLPRPPSPPYPTITLLFCN